VCQYIGTRDFKNGNFSTARKGSAYRHASGRYPGRGKLWCTRTPIPTIEKLFEKTDFQGRAFRRADQYDTAGGWGWFAAVASDPAGRRAVSDFFRPLIRGGTPDQNLLPDGRSECGTIRNMLSASSPRLHRRDQESRSLQRRIWRRIRRTLIVVYVTNMDGKRKEIWRHRGNQFSQRRRHCRPDLQYRFSLGSFRENVFR